MYLESCIVTLPLITATVLAVLKVCAASTFVYYCIAGNFQRG